MRKRLQNIWHSFPLQLLILHLRSNLLFVAMWLMLALTLSGAVGSRLGMQYLFLDPEYMGRVNVWSYLFVGLAFGGFFMSWNLTTYLLNAQHFPFLASLSRPFTKFCVNNSVLPLLFLGFYIGMIIHFQKNYEGTTAGTILLNCLGLLGGIVLLVGLLSLYFLFTNRDISYYTRRKELPPHLLGVIAPGRRGMEVGDIKKDDKRRRVRTYLSENLKPRLVRSVAHYDPRLLMNIFRQNHLNALILQLITLVTLLALGFLIDFPYFRIPAGASIFILTGVIVALTGSITYWFDEWRALILIGLLVLINYVTGFDLFNHRNRAYGLDYEVSPAEYSNERLQDIFSSEQVGADIAHTRQILDRWRARTGEDKPKMVILCVSGGGLRSAVWALQVAQTADSILKGNLLKHTTLITGASGGMLGMAYLRELYLRRQLGADMHMHDKRHIDLISRDMLNALAFTIVSNDLLLPLSTVERAGHIYYKDRGYIFEEQFNENTSYVLDKCLSDYAAPEAQAMIPMLFITPSIVNDGRRMIISPQGVSYMMSVPMGRRRPLSVEVDAVDFGKVFEAQGSRDLQFLTALRMNATYPYVLPNVHLPSEPEIEVMDAGIRDNYGMLSATRFIQVFRKWIEQNTSGVVLVQVSSSELIEEIIPSNRTGAFSRLVNPVGILGKVFTLQEFEHDNSLGFIYDLLGPERFEVIRFVYHPTQRKKLTASVSFHITSREKADVKRAIGLPENKTEMERLMNLLK